MKKSHSPSLGSAPVTKVVGRPASLSKIEAQRYVTLRSWGFSQREAGAVARNLPRGRNGTRPRMGASTCQRLDSLHGSFEAPKLPLGHSADSLRKLPERALVALADARGDVSNRRYLEAAGLRPAVKRAAPVRSRSARAVDEQGRAAPRAPLPVESVTYRAWNRAQLVGMAFSLVPARTMGAQLKNVREWCREWSAPVELDEDALRHLTPWERIAATWDGEFIADADRKTFLLPFRDEMHPNISPASREAILLARNSMHSERPPSTRGTGSCLVETMAGDVAGDVASEIPAEMLDGASGKQAAVMRAAVHAEKQAVKRIRRWAGDDAGEGPVGPFDVDYDQK